MFERGDLIHLPPRDQPGEGGGFWSEDWGVIISYDQLTRHYHIRWVSGDDTHEPSDWAHQHFELVSKA